MNTKQRLQQIKDKLQKLIQTDKEYKIFGAKEGNWGGHEYKLNPVLSTFDLDVFESANQVKLPEEYRIFLTQIANGGAGPYYGLYALDKGIEEAKYLSTDDDNTIENSFATDFPVSKTEVNTFIKYYGKCVEEGKDEEIEYMEIPNPLTGAIFLCEYGSGWSYLLVVKGELAGSVWFHGDYFVPLFDKNKLLTFFDWYENWLDESLAELNPQPQKTEFDTTKTIVSYHGGELEKIPEEVFACKNLKKLIFSSQKLKEFPKQIAQFTELTSLDLSMNPFVEIPDEIGELQKLKKLNLSYNYHIDLPKGMSKLKNLTVLSLFYNYKLSEMPEVATTLPKLKELNFSHSGELTKIPDNIDKLNKLELLKLNNCNNLKALPESIGKLKKLKYLYIDSTNIKQLPASFENLENLLELGISIADLDLADAVEKIKNLPKLTWLRISNLLGFPENFSELQHIRKLVVNENYDLWHKGYKTLSLPENISLLPHLEELYLNGNNQVSSLPENIHKLKHLKILDISSTSIQILPENMQYLPEIEHIGGTLNKDTDSPFGLFPEEKEKLIRWFPNAKIRVW
jgi:Leucine-rich repeat (LRR) protein